MTLLNLDIDMNNNIMFDNFPAKKVLGRANYNFLTATLLKSVAV